MYVLKEDPGRRLLVLDTDFPMEEGYANTPPIKHIQAVEGVADLAVVNRYRAKIEIGRLFNMAEVKAAVEQVLTIDEAVRRAREERRP